MPSKNPSEFDAALNNAKAINNYYDFVIDDDNDDERKMPAIDDGTTAASTPKQKRRKVSPATAAATSRLAASLKTDNNVDVGRRTSNRKMVPRKYFGIEDFVHRTSRDGAKHRMNTPTTSARRHDLEEVISLIDDDVFVSSSSTSSNATSNKDDNPGGRKDRGGRQGCAAREAAITKVNSAADDTNEGENEETKDDENAAIPSTQTVGAEQNVLHPIEEAFAFTSKECLTTSTPATTIPAVTTANILPSASLPTSESEEAGSELLLEFLKDHKDCLKDGVSPGEFHAWLREEDIVCIKYLVEAFEDEDYHDDICNHGLRRFKKKRFRRAAEVAIGMRQ